MSDISFDMPGLRALLIAGALAICLFLGIVICGIIALTAPRQKRGRFRNHPAYPHLLGMSLGLLGAVVVGIIIFLNDGSPLPHTVETWLDRWIPLWVGAVLAPWVVLIIAQKKRRDRQLTSINR